MKAIFTVIMFTIFSHTAISQNISGNWVGELATPKGKLELSFIIIKVGGKYQTSMDIPMQGLKGAIAESTLLTGTTLKISFTSLNLEYTGSVNEAGEIVGNFFKGNSQLPLNLKQGQILLMRPQEPKPPFNYLSQNISFMTSDNLKLEGTLTLPKTGGNFPIVIIVSGSGPQNRDGDMFGHKPYFVIADYLTNNGIGVLRFDERGVDKSEGNFEIATIDILASDVSSAVQYLKSRKDLKIKKIGLIGHSIGGIVAPKVASMDKSINFIVLMAAPAVNGNELMLLQKATLEKSMGLDDSQIAQGQNLVKGAYDIIINSNLQSSILKDSLNSFYTNKYGKIIPQNQRESIVNQITTNEVLSLIRSKPSMYLKKIQCPVLALNGDKDFQVPSKYNLPLIKMIIEKNGNRNVTTIEMEKLNHLFQECKTGMLSEYSQIEQTIAPNLLETVTKWIIETTK